MKHLSNTYNPKAKDAYQHVTRMDGETQDQAWQNHLAWLRGKHIGLPVATDTYTVDQLIAMNMVGVYSVD